MQWSTTVLYVKLYIRHRCAQLFIFGQLSTMLAIDAMSMYDIYSMSCVICMYRGICTCLTQDCSLLLRSLSFLYFSSRLMVRSQCFSRFYLRIAKLVLTAPLCWLLHDLPCGALSKRKACESMTHDVKKALTPAAMKGHFDTYGNMPCPQESFILHSVCTIGTETQI